MQVENISLILALYSSLTNTLAVIDKATHYGSANQEFAEASARRKEHKGLSRYSKASLAFSTQSLLPPYPLPVSKPATQATLTLHKRLSLGFVHKIAF